MKFVHGFILLSFLLLFVFTGCSMESLTPSTESAKTETTTSIPQRTKAHTTQIDETQTYRTEKGGLELIVTLPKQVEERKEFVLTAKIINNTDSQISYSLPSGTPNRHKEIRVKIQDPDGNIATDKDVFGKVSENFMKIALLPAGGEFEQVIHFLPGWREGGDTSVLDESEFSWFPAGPYSGTATFHWGGNYENSGFNENTSSVTVEFPVVIT